MAVLAACTSQGDGEVSGQELAVFFPGGTFGDFQIGRVTVSAQCTGDTQLYPQNEDGGFLGNVIPSRPDPDGDGIGGGTQFITDLEFENDDQGGEIWHTFEDMLGTCGFLVEAFEPDGEKFCVGGGQTTTPVAPGATEKVTVVIACDISQRISTGFVDFDGTTITGVGNYCPLLNSLDLIPDDIPIVADLLYPIQDTTEFWVCGGDFGDIGEIDIATFIATGGAQGALASCGSGDGSAFDRCENGDPRRVTLTCIAETLDAIGGNVTGLSTGVFSDPTDQDSDGDPTTYNGLCLQRNPLIPAGLLPDSKGLFTCDTGAQPGVPVRITCAGDDGDADCLVSISHDLSCPGLNLCTPLPQECMDPDPTDCVDKTQCDATVGGSSCVDTPAPEFQNCTTPAPANGPGECDANGTCVATGCSSDQECADAVPDPCMTATCDLGSGVCNAPVPDNPLGSCTNSVGGPGQCVAGICECTAAVCECEQNTECPGGTECTDIACDQIAGTCGQPVPKSDCDACGSPGDVCFGGTCQTPPALSDTFDMTQSQFRAYNFLLDDLALCGIPDLNPGPNSLKCIEVDGFTENPPDIIGTVALTSTGGTNWDVDVVQELNFVVDAFIASAFSQVLITTTNSLTVLSGTGTGPAGALSAGDTITLDPLAAPNGAFNMQAVDCRPDPNNCPLNVPPTDPLDPNCACAGQVLCQATNVIGIGAQCDATACTDSSLPCNVQTQPTGNETVCTADANCPGFTPGRCDTLGDTCSVNADCGISGVCTGTTCTQSVCNSESAYCPAGDLGQTCGFLSAGTCDPTDTSAAICGLAALGEANGALCTHFPDEEPDPNLAGCLNGLPNPDDNFVRFFEPISLSLAASGAPASPAECNALQYELDGGPSQVPGWYIANPYVLPDPTQFTALSGVQQP